MIRKIDPIVFIGKYTGKLYVVDRYNTDICMWFFSHGDEKHRLNWEAIKTGAEFLGEL